MTANLPFFADSKKLLSFWHQINIECDKIFYDVGALTDDEIILLENNQYIVEGCMLVVPPSEDIIALNKEYKGEKSIKNFSISDFLTRQKNHDTQIDAVVVAGVGSSAVGTAALARSLANYLGRCVAGIVSGRGLTDVVSEGMGGWFGLGVLNAMVNTGEKLHQQMAKGTKQWSEMLGTYVNLLPQVLGRNKKRGQAGVLFDTNSVSDNDPMAEKLLLVNEVPDLFFKPDDYKTLEDILLQENSPVRILVGHSKGNLMLSRALYNVVQKQSDKPLHVVTLGAVVWFPKQYSDVKQYLGDIDVLGKMNSRNLDEIPYQSVKNAWHTLNPMYDGHMPVADIFNDAIPN